MYMFICCIFRLVTILNKRTLKKKYNKLKEQYVSLFFFSPPSVVSALSQWAISSTACFCTMGWSTARAVILMLFKARLYCRAFRFATLVNVSNQCRSWDHFNSWVYLLVLFFFCWFDSIGSRCCLNWFTFPKQLFFFYVFCFHPIVISAFEISIKCVWLSGFSLFLQFSSLFIF